MVPDEKAHKIKIGSTNSQKKKNQEKNLHIFNICDIWIIWLICDYTSIWYSDNLKNVFNFLMYALRWILYNFSEYVDKYTGKMEVYHKVKYENICIFLDFMVLWC